MHTCPATHPSVQQLAAFAAGRLPDADARLVGRHLDACTACRRAAARSSTAIPGGQPALPPSGPELPACLVNHPKFRVLRPLGQGGMGTVFLAEHRVMERPVAIKVVSRALLNKPDALRGFFAEVRAAAKLAHPNIVAAYDAEQAGDGYLFVMEYIEGVDLADYLAQQGPLPIPIACGFIQQAALGLQHAHEEGLVHRDIKPANLMLTPRGQVKILDFGLARLLRERDDGWGQTAAGAFLGTPEYVAPEQATDARTADIRADLYSLGCTLYFLLTGRPPFVEGTAVKLVLAHLEKEPPPLMTFWPEVPPRLEVFLAKALAKDPRQRYQTPMDFARALAPFCNEVAEEPPVSALRSNPAVVAAPTTRLLETADRTPWQDLQVETEPPRGRRSTPRHGRCSPWPWVVGAVGAGLVVALAVWLATPRRMADRVARKSGPSEPVAVSSTNPRATVPQPLRRPQPPLQTGLARGAEPHLKQAAVIGVEEPATPQDEARAGDRWWDLAREEKEPAREEILRLALSWYQKAAPKLEGLEHDRIKARIRELMKNPSLHPLAEFEGKWKITYTNRALREYTIDLGEVTDAEKRQARLTRKDGDVLLDFGDGKLERLRVRNGRLQIEHYNPASNFPAGPIDTVGVGVRAK